MYEIQSKSDFQAGATLIVRIPEEDIDKKALYTIQADQPPFILPFRQRTIDGQIEFVYQVGNRSKLAYLSGKRLPNEYADLWFNLLQPLLDCGDWFMTPYSFVLNSEYLYYDKNGKSINFVYIPSVKAYSDHDSLKDMVTEVANNNSVTDVELENKVLRAIQKFSPREFLQMIKPYKMPSIQRLAPQGTPSSEPKQNINAQSERQPEKQSESKPPKESELDVPKPPVGAQNSPDDIVIDLPPDDKSSKEKKLKKGFFGFGKEGKEKEKKPKQEKKDKNKEKDKDKNKDKSKETGGFWAKFGKKKAPQEEIIQGAAASPTPSEIGHKHNGLPDDPPLINMDDDVTIIDKINESKFRYIGNSDHPRVIEININDGGIFTIGRFDVSVGSKQSDFEFDKRTKAVSRRHAAIERNAGGYHIVDLGSAAGTFINGQKLPPNSPFKLERDFRVSFGHSGADYIWEE